MTLRDVLNEGLIKSYPIDSITGPSAVKYLKSKFHSIIDVEKYYKNPYWISMTEKYPKGDSTYMIHISDLTELDEISNFCDNTLGWMTIGVGVDEYDLSDEYGYKMNVFIKTRDGSKMICPKMEGSPDIYQYYKYCKSMIKNMFIIIEAKFPRKTTDFDHLFHVTFGGYLPNIQKKGFYPHSKGATPPRTYFSRTYENSMDMLNDQFNTSDPPYILALDMNSYGDEIKYKYTFYEDPRDDLSVFTYDCIDPKYILIKLDDEWCGIMDLEFEIIDKKR